MQTMDESSNTSEFIVKKCMGRMAILKNETINVHHLMDANNKVDDAS